MWEIVLINITFMYKMWFILCPQNCSVGLVAIKTMYCTIISSLIQNIKQNPQKLKKGTQQYKIWSAS